jgi:hypothetical protein
MPIDCIQTPRYLHAQELQRLVEVECMHEVSRAVLSQRVLGQLQGLQHNIVADPTRQHQAAHGTQPHIAQVELLDSKVLGLKKIT